MHLAAVESKLPQTELYGGVAKQILIGQLRLKPIFSKKQHVGRDCSERHLKHAGFRCRLQQKARSQGQRLVFGVRGDVEGAPKTRSSLADNLHLEMLQVSATREHANTL